MSRDSRSPSSTCRYGRKRGGNRHSGTPLPLFCFFPLPMQCRLPLKTCTAQQQQRRPRVCGPWLGWVGGHGMEVGLGAGRILLLMAGLVWIFRVAVGKRPTAGNADGMHASSIKRVTESPSHLHLDKGGRNNSLRVNDSRSATISRGSAPLLGDCPARIPGPGRHRRRRRRRQVLPIKEEQTATGSSPTLPGTQGSSKHAAMRPRRLLLLSPLHRTLASSCRAPAPASVGWVGQLTLHAGRDRDMLLPYRRVAGRLARRSLPLSRRPRWHTCCFCFCFCVLLLLAAAQVRGGGGATLLSSNATTGRRGLGREKNRRRQRRGTTGVGNRSSMLESRLLMLHRGGDGKTESQPPVAFHESAGPRPDRAT